MGRAHGRLLRWDEIERDHGIPRGTLKSWVRRGHLTYFAKAGRTHLYLEADVLRCQAAREETGDEPSSPAAVA